MENSALRAANAAAWESLKPLREVATVRSAARNMDERSEARVVNALKKANDPKWNVLDKFPEEDFEKLREQLRVGDPGCPLPLYEKIKHFFDPPTEFPWVDATKDSDEYEAVHAAFHSSAESNARFRKSNFAAIIASAYPSKWCLYDFITNHRVRMMGRDRIILPYINTGNVLEAIDTYCEFFDLRTYRNGDASVRRSNGQVYCREETADTFLVLLEGKATRDMVEACLRLRTKRNGID